MNLYSYLLFIYYNHEVNSRIAAMEQDRYQKNPILYTIGIISLVASMSFFAFTAYTAPSLLLGWIYNVPEFLIDTRQWLSDDYQLTERAASWVIFLFFLLWGFIFGKIASLVSDYIDKQIYKTRSTVEPTAVVEDMKQTAWSVSKVVMIIIVALIASVLLEWIIFIR